MNSLHITNLVVNGIVRFTMVLCLTLLIIKFENLWLTALYLIPGCMMATSISTSKGKGDETDESKNP